MTNIRPETFRHEATLEHLTGAANDYEADGGRRWQKVCELWCSIDPATPAERLAAQQQQTVITHKLRTHWRPELFFPGATAKTFRVIAGRRMFSVQGVVDVGERRRVAELTCVEKT